MDGSVAIEWNRQALKRIVATLVDMAGLAQDAPEARAEGDARKIIPRILWRAILALLRPAESAARRLIIATARGLVVPPPTPRQPKSPTMEPLLRRLGIAIMAPPAGTAPIPPVYGGGGPREAWWRGRFHREGAPNATSPSSIHHAASQASRAIAAMCPRTPRRASSSPA